MRNLECRHCDQLIEDRFPIEEQQLVVRRELTFCVVPESGYINVHEADDG